MAERVGFEPTVEFPQHTLSKRAPSTTRTPLHATKRCRHRLAETARLFYMRTMCASTSFAFAVNESLGARYRLCYTFSALLRGSAIGSTPAFGAGYPGSSPGPGAISFNPLCGPLNSTSLRNGPSFFDSRSGLCWRSPKPVAVPDFRHSPRHPSSLDKIGHRAPGEIWSANFWHTST
jgi:hypothetical protein